MRRVLVKTLTLLFAFSVIASCPSPGGPVEDPDLSYLDSLTQFPLLRGEISVIWMCTASESLKGYRILGWFWL